MCGSIKNNDISSNKKRIDQITMEPNRHNQSGQISSAIYLFAKYIGGYLQSALHILGNKIYKKINIIKSVLYNNRQRIHVAR